MLLDRDGVINENRVDHVKSWDEFKFLPGSIRSLSRLRLAGLKLGLITNQAVIERGIVEQDEVDLIHSNMQERLMKESAQFDRINYCPHRPESNCDCRKPRPGLAASTIQALQVLPENTCIIGDTYGDAMAGLAAGCAYAIRIPSTREPGDYNELPDRYRERVIEFPSLEKATDSILISVEQTL